MSLQSEILYKIFFSSFQDLSSLGLPSVFYDLNGIQQLDVIVTLNTMYDLLQLHHCAVGTVNDLEIEHMKISSDLNTQRLIGSKIKVCSFLCGQRNVTCKNAEHNNTVLQVG